jgi:hypothetical protein
MTPMRRLFPKRRRPVSVARLSGWKVQRPELEPLEERVVLSRLSYVSGVDRIALAAGGGQYAIRLDADKPAEFLRELTAPGGPLAGLTVEESIAPSVWRLGAPAERGLAAGPALDADSFSYPGVEWLTSGFTASGPAGDTRVIVIDELVVDLADGVGASYLDSLAKRLGGFAYRPLLGTPDQFVVTLPGLTGESTVELADALSADPKLDFATPNFYQDMRKFFVPNDPLFPQQWHLNNTGASPAQLPDAIAGADVKAVAAWDVSTGSGVTIAVIDDGMEWTHEDLAANIFVNPGEIPGNSIDDDGNGYVDDVRGWSSVTNSGVISVTNADEHATSVAGIAAGRGNNGIGVAGMAFNAKILPVQIFNGGTFVGDAGAATAVYYAAGRTANGLGQWNAAQVINCSWGGGSPSPVLTAAFTWASNTARGGLGVPTFISSGNGYASTVSYPANLSTTLPGVMAVGATNQQDRRSEYSNYGTALDFVTPSSDIDPPVTGGTTTTDRSGNLGYNVGNYTNNTAANGFGGTSSASPLAAGIGALLVSLNPNISAAQVKQSLRATADKVGGVTYDANGFHVQYGYGRLNALRAVQTVVMAVAGTTPANGSIVAAIPATNAYRVDFTFALDPATINVGGFAVNGVTPTSVTPVDGDTLQLAFAASPVTAQGLQTFTVAAGAVNRLGNGEPTIAFAGSFRYDAVALQVTSTTPPAGTGVFTLPAPFTLDVNFNEAVLPASVTTASLTLSGLAGAAVTAATVLPGNTSARFTIAGVTTEGTLTAAIPAGAITDVFGNPIASFSGNYLVDIGTVPFPTSFVPVNPTGSLVYQASAGSNLQFSGDVDSFALTLDPGQILTLLVRPGAAGLRPTVQVFDPGNALIASAAASAAGQPAYIQAIPVGAGGTFRIAVGGFGTTTGTYTMQATLNGILESETALGGPPNHTVATAQDLSAGSVALSNPLATASRAAVLGQTDPTAYSAAAVTPGLIDISTTGTASTATGDDASQTLSAAQLPGFAFPFFGTTYTSLSFSTNGLITFGGASTAFSNTDLSTSPAQAAIAVLWDDLFIENSGTGTAARRIFYQVLDGGQRLVIQWNNARQLGGSTFYTFQAVLSANGTIDLNYAPSVTAGAVSGATAGIKAAGTTNPSRLLLSFNQAPGALVGANLSTRINPPTVAQPDFYSFTVATADSFSLALTALAAGNINLHLTDAGGNVLIQGTPGATNLTRSLSNWNLPLATGTYYARVTGDGGVPYSLVLARNVAFEAEPNDAQATAQPMLGNGGVLGSITSGSAYFPTTPAFGFVDIAATGTILPPLTNADDATAGLILPFAFPFFGASYTTLFVSTNGLITFGAANPAFINGDLSTAPAEAAIAVFWDDLDTAGGAPDSGVYAQLIGSGLAAQLVIQWNKVAFFDGGAAGDTLTFQAILGADGSIRLNYADLVSGSAPGNNGAGATVGIKEAGTSNPPRLLLANNSGPNNFVGTGRSTLIARPPADDWYAVTLTAASNALTLRTETPAGGAGEFANALVPRIELYSPAGVLVASGALTADGRNQLLQYVAGADGTYAVRVTRSGDTVGEYWLSSRVQARSTSPVQAASLAGVTVDNGSAQRSRVRSLTVDFNGEIATAPSGAFRLVRAGDGLVVPVTASAIAPIAGGRSRVTLGLGGPNLAFGSLPDGNYTLEILGNQVFDSLGAQVDAANNGVAGSTGSYAFHRFFGDGNGDGQVDAADFLVFRAAYLGGTATGANSAFDADGDGVFTLADHVAFMNNFRRRRL